MLRKISIDGYKSIDRASLELENFTLLSGVNSAGKSSVIQAILCMLQPYVNGGTIASLSAYGKNLGQFADIRNTVKGNKQIRFNLKLQDEKGVYEREALIDSDNLKFNYLKNWNDYIQMHQIAYLPVERIGVQRLYELNIGDNSQIGQRGEYVYSYLAYYGQEPLGEEAFLCQPEMVGKSLNNQVNYWLDRLMGFHIQTNIVKDVDQVVVTYSNSQNNRFYRASNVGTGITFVSMLIIAALSCKRGDTLIIENPEIHLHPRAQSLLMEFMAYLSARGLQIILETHSDHIYNGMRKCIKKNILSDESVAAYYLQLDNNMQTEIYRIRFNEQGAEKYHPYGLFDQFDDDLDELLDMQG